MGVDPGAQEHSPFLAVAAERRVAENHAAFAIFDAFPVTAGHTLVVPFEPVGAWWELSPSGQSAVMELVATVRGMLLDDDTRARLLPGVPRPDGFNVGFNDGAAAGQTVAHMHVHVIPRYAGDMPDPRGGVRHVIPDRGNYLASAPSATLPAPTPDDAPPARAAPPIPSPGEAALAADIDSGELMQRVLALLDDGRRSATYKPALLLALVELALERADGPGHLVLQLADVADKVMHLYWPHTRPYAPDFASPATVLRQASTRSSRILDALARLRADTRASASAPLARIAQQHPRAYLRAQRAIATTLAMQPIPRLQRPGAASSTGTGPTTADHPRFLYDDSAFRPEQSPLTPDPPIVLLPGVAQALARNAPLLRIAIEDVWTREVVRLNKLRTEEEQLREFLFGTGRISLRSIAEGLRDSGVARCFWCDRPLGGTTHVDHVIPWSYFANDDLANLVLTDATCNGDKRDRLVSGDLVRRWQERDLDALAVLAVDLQWPLGADRSRAAAASAYRYLADGIPLWRGRRALTPMTAAERSRILTALAAPPH